MDRLFKTRVTDLFDIPHPILCGGLMWLSDARYVAASVNAGGMGFMTARTFPDPGAFRAELQKAKDLTGGKPFGVNIYLSTQPEMNEIFVGHTKILLEEGVRIIETSGVPPKAYLPPLREAGCKIMHKVASVRHAISAMKLDVDAIAVVGAECGGHPGVNPVGSIVQTVRAAQAVSLPVIVGGGFGHGSQIVAAIAMGADAVLLGTRMLIAEEIWAKPAYKQEVLKRDESGSRLVMQTFRNTYRVMDNAASQKVAELETAGVTDYERYRPFAQGTEAKRAYETGDWNLGLLSMGQAAGFADRIAPVSEIYGQLLDEARTALGRLAMVRLQEQ